MFKICGYGIETQITALFHDLPEEEDLNISHDEITRVLMELTDLPLPTVCKVADSIIKLDKNPYKKMYGKNYMKPYLEGIENDELAKPAKLADRTHNLGESLTLSPTIDNIKFNIGEARKTRKWYIELVENTPFAYPLNKTLRKLEFLLINQLNSLSTEQIEEYFIPNTR